MSSAMLKMLFLIAVLAVLLFSIAYDYDIAVNYPIILRSILVGCVLVLISQQIGRLKGASARPNQQ